MGYEKLSEAFMSHLLWPMSYGPVFFSVQPMVSKAAAGGRVEPWAQKFFTEKFLDPVLPAISSNKTGPFLRY